MQEPQHPEEMSSTPCLPGLSTTVASLDLFQELCPRKAIPNYAKRVDVQIPQLNDEGEVIEVKEKEQKKRRRSKVCWRLFACHGCCMPAFGDERRQSLADSTGNLELLCSVPLPLLDCPTVSSL